jgi:long-chain acyl-CoA synthetase
MERIWLKSYPEGVPADINPTAYSSIGEFFAASVDRYRDRIAFICMGRSMSFGELDRLSRAFASYLSNVACLPPGSRVALMMPNLLQYPVALFGALRAGYVVVNCNPLYSPRELHHQLKDSGAGAIVVLENFGQTLERAIEGTQVRAVAVTGVGDLLAARAGSSPILSCAMSVTRFPHGTSREPCARSRSDDCKRSSFRQSSREIWRSFNTPAERRGRRRARC